MPFFEPTARQVLDRWGPAAVGLSVNPMLLLAVVAQESEGNPNASRDEPQIGDESRGLGQVLRGTLEQMQAEGRVPRSVTHDDLWDPHTNLRVTEAVIVRQVGLYAGDLAKSISSYNQGTNLRPDSPRLNPPANPAYVNAVLAYYRWYLDHWPGDLGAPRGAPIAPEPPATEPGAPDGGAGSPTVATTAGIGILVVVAVAALAAASRFLR